MTDKQIIINGVDVRGCEHCLKMTKYRCTIQRDVYKCLCEENPNCHYKNWQRKQQECEMFVEALKNKTDEYNKLAVNYDAFVSMANKQLKAKEQECEELKKIIDEAKTSKLDLKSFLVGEAVQNEYEQQLDQLKVENESLKKQLKYEFDETLLQYSNRLDELHKTLIEIKEFVENEMTPNGDTYTYSYKKSTRC